MGFPVPFTLVVGTPVWAVVLVSLLWIAWGRQIRADAGLWRPIFNSFVVWVCQLLLTYIYPTYFYVYTLLPPTGRIGFAFLLPVIKLLIRVWLSHSVMHLRDELPEVVVLNAEVYNSLFVMYRMQNTLGLMAIDFVQSTLALRDVDHIFREIKALSSNVPLPATSDERHRRGGFLEKAERIIEDRVGHQEQRVTSKHAWSASFAPRIVSMQKRLSSQSTLVRGSVKQIFPLTHPSVDYLTTAGKAHGSIRLPPIDKSTCVTPLATRSSEVRYVDAIQRLLYVTEFLMLLNYVEVIIPFIYCAAISLRARACLTSLTGYDACNVIFFAATYLVIVYHLPNRVYYPQIDIMTDEHLRSTLLSIFLYASLELCSLLTLHCVLVYRLKLPGLVQLAFVLHSQWVGVQSKLVFWVVYNAQATLQHTGALCVSSSCARLDQAVNYQRSL